MDALQRRHIVNLDGRWGAELRDNLDRYDEAHPDRFSTFCHIDWSALARTRGRPGHQRDARLSYATAPRLAPRDSRSGRTSGWGCAIMPGELVLPDDPRIAPVFELAGELGLPILIHVADPIAFFDPIDALQRTARGARRPPRLVVRRARTADLRCS